MPSYITGVTREGDELVFTFSDCNDEIRIPVCCTEETPIDRPDPDNPLPGDLPNARCINASYLTVLALNAMAEMIVAVDPTFLGIPPYAVPGIVDFLNAKGWPLYLVGPIGALLTKWTLESRYLSIASAIESVPFPYGASNAYEDAFCAIPANGEITSAVRSSVAARWEARVTDPDRAFGEFLRIIPIGWLSTEVYKAGATIENPFDYDCSSFDCSESDGGEIPEGGALFDWSILEPNSGWYAVNNFSTSELPGWSGVYTQSPIHQIRTIEREDGVVGAWYGYNRSTGHNTMGIKTSFATPITLRRLSFWATSLTNNTKIAGMYYRVYGEADWKFLASKTWVINSGDFDTFDYGKPTDPLPSIPNVTEVMLVMYTGGGTPRIYWCSVNYDGPFPPNIH